MEKSGARMAMEIEDVVPYAIGDDDEEEEAAGSLPALETGSDALHQLSQLEHVPALWEEVTRLLQMAPPHPRLTRAPPRRNPVAHAASKVGRRRRSAPFGSSRPFMRERV